VRYLTLIFGIWTVLGSSRPAGAQMHEHSAMPAQESTLNFHGQAFLNTNLQIREFTDFYQVESQNWFMAEASRTNGRKRFSAQGMFSLEPFTLRRLGSAQVFQTGETLDGAPLIDYQHPHDLMMRLEAAFEWMRAETTRLRIGGGPVGAAALGPESFMHRASAADNPTVPLSHHQIDSTHIARSVITVGVRHRSMTVEASAFKGREPDEDRLDLDLGVPDSWSGRLTWAAGPWHTQFSAGRLRQPEPNEPHDVTRITASVSYEGTLRTRPIALTIAAGRNLEFDDDVDGVLAEASIHAGPASPHTFYIRGEWVEKNILTAGGLHPPGFTHPHVLSRIGALTGGYVRDIARDLAAGGDATVHAVDPNLKDSYGSPVSFHIYLRWRFSPPR
jgi:hypothetical protein